MPTLLNLPAIQAPQNALLDFSGINNAIDDYRKRSELEARKQSVRDIGQAWQNKDFDQATTLAFRSGDPQLAAHTQQMAQNQQEFERKHRDYTEQKLAAAFQMVDKLPPEQRDAAHDRILALHPEAFKAGFSQLPEIWRNDRGMQRQFLIASVLGPKDPLQQQKTQAEIAHLNASALKDRALADQSKYVPNDPTRPLLNTRTKQYAPMPPEAPENSFDAIRRKEDAKKTGDLEATRKAEIITNAQGANEYNQQRARLESLMKLADTLEKSGTPVFGPVAGTKWYQGYRASVPGILGEPMKYDQAVKLQQEIQATISNMELAVAKLKLKGQGAVTENERAIARNTIGGLLTYNTDAARKVLGSLDLEAQDALQKHADFSKHGLRMVESPAYLNQNNPTPPTNAQAPQPRETTQIPPAAVRALQANPTPELIQKFEEWYGVGSAKQYLR